MLNGRAFYVRGKGGIRVLSTEGQSTGLVGGGYSSCKDDNSDNDDLGGFFHRFQREFAPAIEGKQLAREFQDLHQTTETVVEITAKFRERALLVPQYATYEEMRKTRYHDMLR